MHETFKSESANTIEVLLRFAMSARNNYQLTAYWALKDYMLLNYDCLNTDLQGIICAFVKGSASDLDQVRLECANALSFLITQHLVFTQDELDCRKHQSESVWDFDRSWHYILDALMYLTGSKSLDVRTRAFSTLSTLSTLAAQESHVMQLI